MASIDPSKEAASPPEVQDRVSRKRKQPGMVEGEVDSGETTKMSINQLNVKEEVTGFQQKTPESVNERRQRIERRIMEQDVLQTEAGSEQSAQDLSKEELSWMRNSLKQNVCVNLLQRGYIKSFSEVLTLVGTDNQRRAAADPNSNVRLRTPLEEQEDTLGIMELHLQQAEQAERSGDIWIACERRLFLGHYFSDPQDQWLRMHFFKSCVAAAQGLPERAAVQAQLHMAEMHLERGELQEARRLATLCREQTQDSSLYDSHTCQPLRNMACKVLWRVHSQMIGALLDEANYSETLTLLRTVKAMAIETKEKQVEGEVAYQMGLTYHRAEDYDKAKKFFRACLRIFGKLQDLDRLVMSYKAMAKCLQCEGNVKESVYFLEKLIEICEKTEDKCNLAEIYLTLGKIHYMESQYNKACKFYLQGYEVASELNDMALLQKAQVWVASIKIQVSLRNIKQ